MSGVGERLAAIRVRMDAAAQRAGRDPQEITLIGVSKFQPREAVAEALAAGLTDFGENYVQEFLDKSAALEPLSWHFIGRLQTNKARHLVGRVHLIHAVDRTELVRELGKRARAANLVQPILLEINLGEEATKGGTTQAELEFLAEAAFAEEGLRVDGLMSLPPFFPDPEMTRPFHRRLREARDRLQERFGRALPVLSMGMSQDFEVAIEEGATHVRVGTALFGPRPAQR